MAPAFCLRACRKSPNPWLSTIGILACPRLALAVADGFTDPLFAAAINHAHAQFAGDILAFIDLVDLLHDPVARREFVGPGIDSPQPGDTDNQNQRCGAKGGYDSQSDRASVVLVIRIPGSR